MRQTLLTRLTLVAALLVGGVATAAAQNNQQLDEAARLTFQTAREAFVAGDYETALDRFRQAYQLSQRPGLLYNIAQTLDRLRRDEETLQALRDYLAAAPDAPNRAEVEARIRVLDEAISRRAPAAPPPTEDPPPTAVPEPTPTPAPEPEGDSLAILHPGVFIGLGGAALASGGVLVWAGLETMSLNDSYVATTDVASAQSAYDDATTMQLVTNILIGATGLFAAGAVVTAILTDWGAFDGDSAATGLRPVFFAGATGAQVGLEGGF